MRRTILAFFACAFVSLACAAANAPAKQATDIALDFRITIHDYPGLSEWKPFETTITSDGTVLQKVSTGRGWTHKRALIARRDVSALFKVIQKQSFFSLAADYPTDAEDCATFVVDVRANGRTHKVRFATCFRAKGNKKESKRFLRVWAAALRAYPSPNRDDKPEDYER